MKVLCLLLALCAPVVAQQREFLSESEVEKIREAQEPNERLRLYVLFARQRMDQVQQQLSKDRKGRSLEIRTLLDEYEKIIDAIDRVSDDALKRKSELIGGLNAVREAERKFMTQLEKIKASGPRDLDMYSVELTEAIATTKDSLDLAQQSTEVRTERVIDAADEEKRTVQSITEMESKATGVAPPGDKPATAAPGRRKPPTLIREGEKPPDPPRPPNTPKPPPM